MVMSSLRRLLTCYAVCWGASPRDQSQKLVGLLPVLFLRATLSLGALVFVTGPFHVQILATHGPPLGRHRPYGACISTRPRAPLLRAYETWWRSGRDSNSRTGYARYGISSADSRNCLF